MKPYNSQDAEVKVDSCHHCPKHFKETCKYKLAIIYLYSSMIVGTTPIHSIFLLKEDSNLFVEWKLSTLSRA